MFEIENNKIGNYISSLITNKFDSARSFCREYLKISGEKINVVKRSMRIRSKMWQIVFYKLKGDKSNSKVLTRLWVNELIRQHKKL